MKITERARRRMAFLLIEEISTYAQSTDPKRDWKESGEAINRIYRLAHTINNPGCRKNHPAWTSDLDREVRANRLGKK